MDVALRGPTNPLPHSPHSQEPLALMKRAVAARLGVAEDDPLVQAIAVAYHDTATAMVRVVGARYGRVSIVIKDGWIDGRAVELTELPDPDNRRRAAREG